MLRVMLCAAALRHAAFVGEPPRVIAHVMTGDFLEGYLVNGRFLNDGSVSAAELQNPNTPFGQNIHAARL
jgi:hypothetical protein